MLRSSLARTLLIAIVSLVGILFALPNVLGDRALEWWPDWLPNERVVLGLDLQGGSHLLLQVNRDDIVNQRITDLRRDARTILANEAGIGNVITTEGSTLFIELTDPGQRDAAREALRALENQIAGSMFEVGGVDEVRIGQTPDGRLSVTLTEEAIRARMSALVTQSTEVIRRRIDELGTTEPMIQRQGDERVVVQVPGFDDSERLKDLISRTARLTFHLVHPTMSAQQAEAQGVPIGYMVVPSVDGFDELINENVALGGESLIDSQPAFDPQTNQPVVTFRFDTRGAMVFGEITSQNVGRRFAIMLDGQVITAPNIMTAITGGTGQIQGSFTPDSASDLAVLLRAGALPATLDVVEERSVGPSLGADSVRAGLIAGIVGTIAVAAFMLIVYGKFGVIANISLVLNIALLLGALSALGATLTLPGIAGIVLTIGMAVDANVLIYERIREEMQGGRSAFQAMQAGFQRAMGTIIDANVTSFIATVILFFLGSGPVQGFAVTLALGILTTVFTSVIVTQWLLGRWYAWRRPKTLKVHLVELVPENTKIPFMSMRKAAFVVSTVAMLGSIGLFFGQGLNLGIDFMGGTAIEIQSVDGPADLGEVRSRLGTVGLGEVQVQGFGTDEDVLIRIETQEGGEVAQQEALQAIGDALGEQYEIRRVEAVSATVSGELATAGTIAVLAAIVGILVYIWFRFEWQFAIGVVIGLVHDVILTIGIFALFGLEFNIASIAALLTVVGYSLNDTVVLYDRIREYMRKYRKMRLSEMIDMAMNSVLSRTVMTGITTLFALGALVVFGGEVIRSFTIAMTWGVIVGTYSSIFIAGPTLILLGMKTRAETADEPEAAKAEKRTDGAAV